MARFNYFASKAWLYSFFGTINFDQFLYHAWHSLSTLQSADPIFLKVSAFIVS